MSTAPGALEVQVFGVKKSSDTRKALRFFAERRVRTHFVDLTERAASRGELTRFVQKFGLTALIDRSSRRYEELGLGASRHGDEKWLQLLEQEPLLLRMPLVRCKQQLSIGADEAAWKAWVTK
jgi:arsenate reductase-like glutaredoxin family protein